MRPLCRFLLLCLMAIALPVQGFAAAGMKHCGPMHDRMQAAMAAQAVHHDDGHVHHHDADGAPQGHDGGADAADHAPAAEKSRAATAAVKCSACAACCVALGLPASALQLPQPPAEGLQPPLVTAEAAAFLTGGLERPPRTVLA